MSEVPPPSELDAADLDGYYDKFYVHDAGEIRHHLQRLAGERCALNASNPPYIALGDAHLAQGDLRFEPAMALSSGPDGLDALRTIARDAPACLLPRGWLLLEHGWEQGEAVRALLNAAGFVEIVTARDLEQRERISLGRRP